MYSVSFNKWFISYLLQSLLCHLGHHLQHISINQLLFAFQVLKYQHALSSESDTLSETSSASSSPTASSSKPCSQHNIFHVLQKEKDESGFVDYNHVCVRLINKPTIFTHVTIAFCKTKAVYNQLKYIFVNYTQTLFVSKTN